MHILLVFVAFCRSLRQGGEVLKWHVLRSLSKIGIYFFKWQREDICRMSWKTKSCNYPRSFARYLYFIFFFLPTTETARICWKPNNTRPYSQITAAPSAPATCYKYSTHREKANLDAQEHDRTHFVSAICIPWFMGTRGFIIISGGCLLILLPYNKKIYFTHVSLDQKKQKKTNKS